MNNRSRGFTLVELVVIIVLLSVAGTAILAMFGQVGRSLVTNQDTQTGTQAAQACAEQILAFRHSPLPGYGYANVAVGANTGACNSVFAAAGGVTTAPTVSVVSHSSGTLPACPSATAADCKLVTITVLSSGAQAANLSLMLVNY